MCNNRLLLPNNSNGTKSFKNITFCNHEHFIILYDLKPIISLKKHVYNFHVKSLTVQKCFPK